MKSFTSPRVAIGREQNRPDTNEYVVWEVLLDRDKVGKTREFWTGKLDTGPDAQWRVLPAISPGHAALDAIVCVVASIYESLEQFKAGLGSDADKFTMNVCRFETGLRETRFRLFKVLQTLAHESRREAVLREYVAWDLCDYRYRAHVYTLGRVVLEDKEIRTVHRSQLWVLRRERWLRWCTFLRALAIFYDPMLPLLYIPECDPYYLQYHFRKQDKERGNTSWDMIADKSRDNARAEREARDSELNKGAGKSTS